MEVEGQEGVLWRKQAQSGGEQLAKLGASTGNVFLCGQPVFRMNCYRGMCCTLVLSCLFKLGGEPKFTGLQGGKKPN